VNRKPINQQTDVFNLGATLYWNLTGKHIPTLYTVNKKGENSFLLDDRIDTPMDLNPKVPQAVSNLVMDCVSTRQQKRPVDMDAVITRLELGRHIIQKGQTAAGGGGNTNPGATTGEGAAKGDRSERPPESPAPSPAAG
jgi:hypothetical protein